VATSGAVGHLISESRPAMNVTKPRDRKEGYHSLPDPTYSAWVGLRHGPGCAAQSSIVARIRLLGRTARACRLIFDLADDEGFRD
jgi:hypothetical protein